MGQRTTEVPEDDLSVIANIIKESKDGISFNTLWAELEGKLDFSERSELSRALFVLGHRKTALRNGSFYCHKDNPVPNIPAMSPGRITAYRAEDEAKSQKVTEEIKVLVKELGLAAMNENNDASENIEQTEKEHRVIRIENKPAGPVEDSSTGSNRQYKPFGSLRRYFKGKGAVAYALYKAGKDRWLNVDDVIKLTGVSSKQQAYLVLKELAEDKYIEKHAPSIRSQRFKWADHYRYPFPEYKAEDVSLLLISLDDYFTPSNDDMNGQIVDLAKNQDSDTPAPEELSTPEPIIAHKQNPNQSADSGLPISLKLGFIDFQIQTYQAHIDTLQEMRSALMDEMNNIPD